MINNNENKKLSGYRKKRIEGKNKMDDNMESILNKIETEKKNNIKIFDKIKNLKVKIIKIKYVNNPNKA